MSAVKDLTIPIMVYGSFGPRLSKKEFHGSTYLEYEIPEKLEKKLTKIVEKELSKFYKKCNCNSCKERRKRKNKKI